ncbi:MAG: cytochrome c biogenesis protein CcdA [Candidatus Omnitrophota bacterium]|nr:MAG: cytochrome c biogenesis protein CcdA [Candidatus Omnitrophota bacterium]
MNVKDYPVIISFITGIISFISPCILPLIPAYISFISGYSIEEFVEGNYSIKKNLAVSFLFVLGFTLIFTSLGASATSIGKILGNYRDIIRKEGGIIVILFGLHISRVIKIKSLYKKRKSDIIKRKSLYKERKLYMKFKEIKKINYIMPFIFGMIFAIGWTPCAGPLLSSILVMASMEEKVKRGILLLFFYSLGLGIPFLITSLVVGRLVNFLKRIRRFYRIVEILSGLVLITIGILLLLDKLRFII